MNTSELTFENYAEKTWLVLVPVEVTAADEAEAIRYALDDLRDLDIPWERGWIDVKQTHDLYSMIILQGQCWVCARGGRAC